MKMSGAVAAEQTLCRPVGTRHSRPSSHELHEAEPGPVFQHRWNGRLTNLRELLRKQGATVGQIACAGPGRERHHDWSPHANRVDHFNRHATSAARAEAQRTIEGCRQATKCTPLYAPAPPLAEARAHRLRNMRKTVIIARTLRERVVFVRRTASLDAKTVASISFWSTQRVVRSATSNVAAGRFGGPNAGSRFLPPFRQQRGALLQQGGNHLKCPIRIVCPSSAPARNDL